MLLKQENKNLIKICVGAVSCDTVQKLIDELWLVGAELRKSEHRIYKLETELSSAQETIKVLTQEKEELEKQNKELTAKNNLLNDMVFSKKSEKKIEKEVSQATTNKKRGARENHPGHGRKIPENLEIVDLPPIDIQGDEKYCKHCGLPFEEIREEESYEVSVETKYYVKKIRRKVYKKTCKCSNTKSIIIAPAPKKLIPKGKYATEFWVDVLINKYQNHLPVERQVSEMKDYGLSISSGSIFAGLEKIHFIYLKSLYEAFIKILRESDHWHADETGWHLFVKIDGKENYKWFLWVFISKEIVLFVLHPTRSTEVPSKILFNIDPEELKSIKEPIGNTPVKKMSVDKYSVYKRLEKLGLVELYFCWAHQRREFTRAKVKYPELKSWSEEWVKRIGELYHINNERIKYNPEDISFKEYDTELRKKIDEMYSLINAEYNHPGQISVIDSIKEHWKGLTLFVDNSDIPMDNNLAERILRPAVLGRKNYWGNHSPWGCDLTCEMYSIIETCHLNEISPRAYLTYYLKECQKRGSAPSENEIVSFLPHKLDESLKNGLKYHR